MSIIRFLAKRVASLFAILAALTAVVFVLQRSSRADPVRVLLGANASQAIVAAERRKLGYDQPLYHQYIHYIEQVVQGNFGESLRTQRPVSTDLRVFLPATLELIGAIVVIAGSVGLILALLTARARRGAGVLRVAMAVGASAPGYLVGLLLILLLYLRLGWLPASGQSSVSNPPTGPTGFLLVDAALAGRGSTMVDAIGHLIIPATAAATAPAVALALVLRSNLMATLRADYIRTAQLKGLDDRTVMWRHALRNSAGPALSVSGLLLASLFSGTLVVETIVSWPGLGLYTAQSLQSDDFPAIAGITLVLGAVYLAVNTSVEVIQSLLDPRLRL